MPKKNEQTTRTAIAMKLIDYRHRHGLTQREMAEKLQTPFKSYQSYEERRAKPHLELMCQLSDMFGISVKELTSRV